MNFSGIRKHTGLFLFTVMLLKSCVFQGSKGKLNSTHIPTNLLSSSVLSGLFTVLLTGAIQLSIAEVPSLKDKTIISKPTNKIENVSLTSSNVIDYKNLLPSFLSLLIEKNLFAAAVVKKLNYQWHYYTEGSVPELKSLSTASTSNFLQAYNILEDSLSLQFSAGNFVYSGSLKWFSSHRVRKSVKFSLLKTRKISNPPSISLVEQLSFVEVFKSDLVPPLSGLSHTTLRKNTAEHDHYWICSPVLKYSRKIPDTLRGDSILASSFSLDDFFTNSLRIKDSKAQIIDEKKLLLPFLSESSLKINSPKNIPHNLSRLFPKSPSKSYSVIGKYKDKYNNRVSTKWNADFKAWPSSSPWIPNQIIFTPRDVWVIELYPNDPYYPTGKQILYVDKESFLPVYKEIFNKSGDLEKTIISAWGLATTKDQISKISNDETKSSSKYAIPFLGVMIAIPTSINKIISDPSSTDTVSAWVTSRADFFPTTEKQTIAATLPTKNKCF